MNTCVGFPPCYEEIMRFFPVSIYNVFAYSPFLYVHPLNDLPLTPDVELHEEIHMNQQTTEPALWWQRWLVDREFRLRQELEAYQAQYRFIKKNVPTKYHKEFLFALADDLSSPTYGLDISFSTSETLIRRSGV